MIHTQYMQVVCVASSDSEIYLKIYLEILISRFK